MANPLLTVFHPTPPIPGTRVYVERMEQMPGSLQLTLESPKDSVSIALTPMNAKLIGETLLRMSEDG